MPLSARLRASLRASVIARPGYWNYVVAMLFGGTGFWVARIAQDWLLLKLTNSLVMVGLAQALQNAPLLLLGLWGGVLADRFSSRTLLNIAQAGVGLSALTLGVLTLTGHVRPWHVLAAAVFVGFTQVLEQPARASMVPLLSGPQLPQALSLNSVAFQGSGFWGPALSAILIGSVGTGWAFIANAGGCVVTLVLISLIRELPAPVVTGHRPTVGEGIATIRRTSQIAWTMVLVGVLSLTLLNMPVIYADMATHVFHRGVNGYSQFNSLAALGSVAGSLLAGRFVTPIRLRLLTLSLAGIATLMVSAALSPWPALFGAIILLAALLTVMFTLRASGLIQMSTVQAARGRVMSVYIIVLLGGQAIGGPVMGRFVDAVGGRTALLSSALVAATASAVLAWWMARISGQLPTLAHRQAALRPIFTISAPGERTTRGRHAHHPAKARRLGIRPLDLTPRRLRQPSVDSPRG
ncbi:MAG TPA: MFS transporter [Propionibacteriaceae bacterium]|nr:MFS transporter [Propionibacteriaceae bacterium]